MTSPSDVCALLSTAGPTRPRLTHYDPAGRIELSGRVLTNWVAKAANLLVEEFDAGPGDIVAVDLPAGHWRGAYWSLATWAVGATLSLSPRDPADVRVACRASGAAADPLIAVTLAPLARRHPDLPPGALDEAAHLATYGDDFDALQEPDPTQTALLAGDAQWTYTDVVPLGDAPGQRLLLAGGSDAAATLRAMVGAWAADGSVVVLEPGGGDTERVAADEGVTRRG